MLVFGGLLFVLGSFGFIKSWQEGFDTTFLGGNWNFVFNILQGILFIGLYFYSRKNTKYFMEWDDQQITYYLPDTTKPQHCLFHSIKEVQIKLLNIEFSTPEGQKNLSLELLNYEDIKDLKSLFLRIKNKIETNSNHTSMFNSQKVEP